LWGLQDPILVAENVSEDGQDLTVPTIDDFVSDLRIVRFDDTGHFLQHERVLEVAIEIEKFVARRAPYPQPPMSIDEDIKTAELELKRIEIAERKSALAARGRFDLAGAAVWVTMIGGLSAVLFQDIGLKTSSLQRTQA
jgi:hypothetical protein